MSHKHIISFVKPDSIAEEMGIEPGDCLLSVDDQEIEDVFDYRYYIEDTVYVDRDKCIHLLLYRRRADCAPD